MVPDLLGYGQNVDVRPEKISLLTQAEFVVSKVREIGYSDIHLVGHSVGGAIAMLVAEQVPELVESVVNVEGNFTLNDAFWSKKFAAMSESDIDAHLQKNIANPGAWLAQAGIDATPDRIAHVEQGFRAQSATTIKAMAQSVVQLTADPNYLKVVGKVFDNGTPVHLVAGERSRMGWDVPDFVLRRAASMTVQPMVGHMMMLEDPEAFLAIIATLVS